MEVLRTDVLTTLLEPLSIKDPAFLEFDVDAVAGILPFAVTWIMTVTLE
jgi:hypothetical protein